MTTTKTKKKNSNNNTTIYSGDGKRILYQSTGEEVGSTTYGGDGRILSEE